MEIPYIFCESLEKFESIKNIAMIANIDNDMILRIKELEIDKNILNKELYVTNLNEFIHEEEPHSRVWYWIELEKNLNLLMDFLIPTSFLKFK